MTQFRVGDVVRTLGLPGGGVVTWVGNASVALSHVYIPFDEVTLLRRPVRVGDVLTKPRNCVAVTEHDGMTTSCGFGSSVFKATELPRRTMSDWSINGILIGVGGITHEDGTLIELPAPQRPTGIAARFAHVQEMLSPSDGSLPLISPEQARTLLDLPDIAPSSLQNGRIVHVSTPAPGGGRFYDQWSPLDRLTSNTLPMRAGRAEELQAEIAQATKRVQENMAKMWWGEDPAEPEASLPTVERMARALFETDPDAAAFIASRSESEGHHTCVAESGVECESCARRAKVAQIAWDRNEGGWAETATERAAAVLRALQS